jgi:hypothetical protein
MKSQLIIFVFIYSCFAFGQDKDTSDSHTGMLYGKNHVFAVSSPKGWVLDNQSGVSQGVHAVFYPIGGSWKNSPTVMYAHGNAKDSIPETIETFISNDSVSFVERDPSIKILDAPILKTKRGNPAIVKWFFYSQFEAVAYIDESKSVAMIVMTARTEEEFKNNYPAFEELVGSYWFISDVVTYPEK